MGIGMVPSIVEDGGRHLPVHVPAAHLIAMVALRVFSQQIQTGVNVVAARFADWAFAAQAATASIQMRQRVIRVPQGPFPKVEPQVAKVAMRDTIVTRRVLLLGRILAQRATGAAWARSLPTKTPALRESTARPPLQPRMRPA